MSYYIIVNDDDTLYGSQKKRVMQRSKLVDDLIFVVDPIYRDKYNLANASVLMEYVLPVSRKYDTINLVLSNERYNDCFLQYKLPFDVNLTSEAGALELQLTFAWVEMNENGIGIQRVRKTMPTTIDIVPITAWSDIVPDSALSAIDQRLIKLDAQMRGLNDYMDVLDNYRVDNLVYNDKEETLQLTSNGVGIGGKVSVRDMLDDGIPVVDLNSGTSGGTSSGNGNDNECGCNDCDCWDNVVEFGYSPNNGCSCDNCNCEDNVVEFGYIPDVPKEDDDSNVLEF